MKRAGVLTVVGAFLPFVLGATLGSATTADGEGTLAHPMPPSAFLWLSVGLAAAHLLVLVGYLAVAAHVRGRARSFAQVGAAGTAAVAAVEVWAGLIAEADRDGGAVAALDAAYVACAVVIAVGTVGAGVLLWSAERRLALPLLVNGLLLGLVVVPVRVLGSDVLGIAALTVWSATYAWLGWVLWRTRPDAGPVHVDARRGAPTATAE